MVSKIIGILLILIASFTFNAFAMTDNGDGTRTFTIGLTGDFPSKGRVVWGVPAGVMDGDTLSGIVVTFDAATGSYYKRKFEEDLFDERIKITW